MSLPIVAIVGRPNVGKSSLLNCLAGRRIAIVDPTPGVTRDRISTPLPVNDGYVELVDTGGMGIEDIDNLTDHVEEQIAFGIDSAELILFVVDAREGITALDKHVAAKLRRQNKPVILLANKIDQADLISEVHEMSRLGFGDALQVSAAHSTGIADLINLINEKLPHATDHKPEETMKLAIVGKRNAGKSTFINMLAGEQRVIVSEIPGTTRDSVDVGIEHEGRNFTLIDTAGVQKKRKVAGDIEFYSLHRALRSVRRADVVVMMIDASLPVSQVDKNLAGIIAEYHKPVVLVVNKWDLAEKIANIDDYADYFAKKFPELSFAPISLTTATEGVNVFETIQLAEQLYDQSRQRVNTALLNEAIEEIVQLRGPSHKAGTRRPKILYAAQVSTAPPTIVVFVNDVRSFDMGYQRFLINRFRERLPFAEVPMRLIIRQRRRDEK